MSNKDKSVRRLLVEAKELQELAKERVYEALGSDTNPRGYSEDQLEVALNSDDDLELRVDFTDSCFPETPEQVVKEHADALRALGIVVVQTIGIDYAMVPEKGDQTTNASDNAAAALSRVVWCNCDAHEKDKRKGESLQAGDPDLDDNI